MFDMFFVESEKLDALSNKLAQGYTLAWQLTAAGSEGDAVERAVEHARAFGMRDGLGYALDVEPGNDDEARAMLVERWASGREGVLFGARTRREFNEAHDWKIRAAAEGLGVSEDVIRRAAGE